MCSISAYRVTKVICNITLYYSHCNTVLLSRELYYYVSNSKNFYVNMKNKVDFIQTCMANCFERENQAEAIMCI